MVAKYSDLTEKELLVANELLLSRLGVVLSSHDWKETLFLQVNERKIQEIVESTQSMIDAFNKTVSPSVHAGSLDATPSSAVVSTHKEGAEQVRIFISLFVNEGASIENWEAAVLGLQSYTFGRPVYEEKQHCEELLRSKSDLRNEGYAVIDVDADMIIRRPNNASLKDKFGNELLTLRQGAISLRNIKGFVHGDNTAFYVLQARGLVKVESYMRIFD